MTREGGGGVRNAITLNHLQYINDNCEENIAYPRQDVAPGKDIKVFLLATRVDHPTFTAHQLSFIKALLNS